MQRNSSKVIRRRREEERGNRKGREGKRKMEGGKGKIDRKMTGSVDWGRPSETFVDLFGALDRVPINNRGSNHVIKRLMRWKMTLPSNDPGEAGAIP